MQREMTRRGFLEKAGRAMVAAGALSLVPGFDFGGEAYADSGRGKIQIGDLEFDIYDPSETKTPGEYEDPSNAGVPLIYVPREMLDRNITENFKTKEFALVPTPSHNRNTGIEMQEFGGRTYNQFIRLSPELPNRLQILRDEIGGGITILSPYRTKTYNHMVGGKGKSTHKAGLADDITSRVGVERLRDAAEEVFSDGGLGYYPDNDFIHVDVRGTRARWTVRDKSVRVP